MYCKSRVPRMDDSLQSSGMETLLTCAVRSLIMHKSRVSLIRISMKSSPFMWPFWSGAPSDAMAHHMRAGTTDSCRRAVEDRGGQMETGSVPAKSFSEFSGFLAVRLGARNNRNKKAAWGRVSGRIFVSRANCLNPAVSCQWTRRCAFYFFVWLEPQ